MRYTTLTSWLLCAASVAATGVFEEGDAHQQLAVLGRAEAGTPEVLIEDDAIITPPPGAPQPSQTPVSFFQHVDDGLIPQPTQPPEFDKRQNDNPQEAINAASRSAQQAVASASQSAAEAVRQAQESVRRADESARQAIAQATRDASEAARQARESADQAIAQASRGADDRVRQANQSAQQAAQAAQESARREIDRSFSLVQAARADATAVRVSLRCLLILPTFS